MSWIGWMLNKKLHIPLGHMQKKKKKKINKKINKIFYQFNFKLIN